MSLSMHLSLSMHQTLSMSEAFEIMAAAIISKAKGSSPKSTARLPNPPGLNEDIPLYPWELFSQLPVGLNDSAADERDSLDLFDDESETSDDDDDDEDSEDEENSYLSNAIKAYPTDELAYLIADKISSTVDVNDTIPSDGSASLSLNTLHARSYLWHTLAPQSQEQTMIAWPNTPFFSNTTFDVSVEEYLLRIVSWCNVSNEVLLTASVYLDRVVQLSDKLCTTECYEEKPFALNSSTVFRAILVAVYAAIKYQAKKSVDADYFAKVGSVEMAELLELDNAFVRLIDYDLEVSKEEMHSHVDSLFL